MTQYATTLEKPVVKSSARPAVAPVPKIPKAPVTVDSATEDSTTVDTKLTLTGKITTGVLAVCGETTGVLLIVGGTRYELDIKEPAHKSKAQIHNGNRVIVKGSLMLKRGIEVGLRRIVSVESLESDESLIGRPDE